jgi:hypothetical protein
VVMVMLCSVMLIWAMVMRCKVLLRKVWQWYRDAKLGFVMRGLARSCNGIQKIIREEARSCQI